MAGGVSLDTFVDVFLGTSQAVLTGPKNLINEAQKRRTLLRQILNSHDFDTMLKGGDRITDQVIFDEDNTYGSYNLLETRTPHLGNHLTEIAVDWAFTDAHVTFSKHEKGINGVGDLNRTAMAKRFKDVIHAKWSNLFISINNGMERELIAQPNVSTMETVTTQKRVPYSIFCTLTEFGAVAGPKPTGTIPVGFTTVQGINPTTQPRWRNPVQFYTEGRVLRSAARWDGFSAMSRMYDRLNFEELAIRPEYGETGEPEGFIAVSIVGKQLWEDNTATANDHLRYGPSNPGIPSGALQYNGVPVRYIELLDHAVVWPATSGAAFGGETDATLDEAGNATTNPDSTGPRFIWIVPKYFKKIMHSDHFLEEERPPQSVYQPYVRTVYFDCWHQTFNRSRQRAGGIVAPGGDISGF